MTKFRSKPVEIEAFQLTQELINECFANNTTPSYMNMSSTRVMAKPDKFECFSKQGWVPAYLGDWIVAEPGGIGCYPCHPENFAAKYEPIE